MIRLITSTALCLSVFLIQAQESVLVFGVETSFNYFSQTEIRKSAFTTPVGVHIEYPFGQFSVGTGILYVNYGTYSYGHYSGEYLITKNDGFLRKNYINERYESRVKYIGIPIRVQYRLPCNCVYFQASFESDILTDVTEASFKGTTVSYKQANNFNYSALKKTNQRFCFGVGFKLHKTHFSRIYMRPEFEYMLNPWRAYNTDVANDAFALKITFGAQFGFAYR